MLKLKNINKTFFPNSINERVALSNINLEIGHTDFVTIIGSNGAGKSTVLNTIAGKISPDTGIVDIAGKNVTRMKDYKRAKYVGRVFQDPMAGTAPDLTIEQNMALAERRGMPRGLAFGITKTKQIGRASCRERVKPAGWMVDGKTQRGRELNGQHTVKRDG